MIKKIILKLQDFWRRLTWMHVVSFHSKQKILEKDKWYSVHYYMMLEGKKVRIDKIRITEVKHPQVEDDLELGIVNNKKDRGIMF